MMLAERKKAIQVTPVSSPNKFAIVTGRHYHTGQLVINRHISELNGGQNCVICYDRVNPELIRKDSFFRAEIRGDRFDFLTKIPEKVRNYRNFHTGYIPAGRKRVMLESFLREQKVSRILVEFGNLTPSIWPIAKSMGIPIFAYFRGFDATGYLDAPFKRGRRLDAYRVMFENIDGVFSVSNFLLERMAALGLRHNNSYVIPSGVDTSLFAANKKEPYLVASVGRFIEKKAPQLAINAFARASKDFPGAVLVMVGEGELLNECKRLVSKLGVEDKVRFLGGIEHSKVAEILSRCDVYLQHSVKGRNGDSEGVPTALQEAMAAGCAVLATRHAGSPEIIEDQRSGRLIDEHDIDALEENLRDLFENRQVCRQLGSEASIFAKKNLEYRSLYKKIEEIMGN
jgi:colanic acid/amylovoran biosynthesis glycosyltransferase